MLSACGAGDAPPEEPDRPDPSEPRLDNHVIVTDRSGTTLADYPVQLARPFVAGELMAHSQELLDGVPVTTQADVTQRHPRVRELAAQREHSSFAVHGAERGLGLPTPPVRNLCTRRYPPTSSLH